MQKMTSDLFKILPTNYLFTNHKYIFICMYIHIVMINKYILDFVYLCHESLSATFAFMKFYKQQSSGR